MKLRSVHFQLNGLLSRALRLLNSIGGTHVHTKPPIVYAALLQTATKALSFSLGLQLHTHIVKSGLDSDRFVGNSLLSLYFKLCPDFSVTRRVFDNLPSRDVISWTSMVSGYVRAGEPSESLRLFGEMSDVGVEPNAFTLSAAIKACSDLGDPKLGRGFHGMVLGRGFDSNHVLASSLMDMYGRNSGSEDALRVFGEMTAPDAICWTSLISALTRNDRFEEAVGSFHSMQREHGLAPDEFTLGTVLTALGNLGRARQGREVHARVVTCGMSGNVVVESSVVDMYAKCASSSSSSSSSMEMEDSRRVFDRMATKNAVSWCALLGGYCQTGDYESVLEIFRDMDTEDDNYSLGTVLRACAGLAAVRQGKEVHCQFLRTGGRRDVIVESALVDLYAKCGLVDCAYRVFVKISAKNLITWNAMVCGFAQNGRGGEAVGVFNEMVARGIRADYITFIGVLFACNHSGLVDEGRRYFKSMSDEYGISAGIEHYNCMVDLLGRAGLLEEAEDLIKNAAAVFRDDPSLWAALLGGCAAYTDPAVAERVARKMMELDPGYHLSYVLLANVYKSVGRWDDALEIRRIMGQRRVRKTPGKSWIEVQSNILNHRSKTRHSDTGGGGLSSEGVL